MLQRSEVAGYFSMQKYKSSESSISTVIPANCGVLETRMSLYRHSAHGENPIQMFSQIGGSNVGLTSLRQALSMSLS
jgi:hypothetical protein